MFTVSGAGIIDPDSEVKEYPLDNHLSILVNLKLIAKDPYKQNRHYYNCSIIVPLKAIEVARKKIVPGKLIQIRIGELKGKKTHTGSVFNDIQTKWQWVEILNALPNKERKEDS